MLYKANKNTADKKGVVIGGTNYGLVNTGTIVNNIITVSNGQTYECKLVRDFVKPGVLETDMGLALLEWKQSFPSQLVGRETEFSALRKWAKSSPQFSCGILCGDGGTGKTRLAFELAKELANGHWEAGSPNLALKDIAIPLGALGTLLIIDYPEEQETKKLEGLLKTLKQAVIGSEDNTKLRVLLLSRNQALLEINIINTHCYSTLKPLTLKPLDEVNPFDLHQSAIEELKIRFQLDAQPCDKELFDQWLKKDPVHGLPLMVLAYSINCAKDPDSISMIGGELIQQILNREDELIRKKCQTIGKESLYAGVLLLRSISVVTNGLDYSTLGQLWKEFEPKDLGGIQLPSPYDLTELGFCINDQPLYPIAPDLFAAHELFKRPYTIQWPILLPLLLNTSPAPILNRLSRLAWDYKVLKRHKAEAIPCLRT